MLVATEQGEAEPGRSPGLSDSWLRRSVSMSPCLWSGGTEGRGIPLLPLANHTSPETSLFPLAGLHAKLKPCISQIGPGSLFLWAFPIVT